jgi:phage-related protein
VVSVPGSIVSLDLSRIDSVEPRRLELSGTIAAASNALLRSNLDALKRRLTGRTLDIILPDDATRYFRGYLEEVVVSPIAPAFSQRASFVNIRIMCVDPRAFSTTEEEVVFTTDWTNLELGTAPSFPLIRIVNPSSPIIQYRDSTEVIRGEIVLTLGIADGWVEIDSENFRIYDDDGTNRISTLTSGNFFMLDPKDGFADASGWPQIRYAPGSVGVGGSAVVTYRKAWW